jgi:hypothetical protein
VELTEHADAPTICEIGCSVFEKVKQEDGMNKSDEYARKIAELIKLADRHNIKVKESSTGSIGFVGGVRRPEAKSVDDGNPDGSPKQSVN